MASNEYKSDSKPRRWLQFYAKGNIAVIVFLKGGVTVKISRLRIHTYCKICQNWIISSMQMIISKMKVILCVKCNLSLYCVLLVIPTKGDSYAIKIRICVMVRKNKIEYTICSICSTCLISSGIRLSKGTDHLVQLEILLHILHIDRISLKRQNFLSIPRKHLCQVHVCRMHCRNNGSIVQLIEQVDKLIYR